MVVWLHPRSLKGRINTKQKANNMKNNRSLFAALVAAVLVAVAILVAPVSDSVKVSGIFGYGVVLALVTLAVMEYGRGSSHDTSR